MVRNYNEGLSTGRGESTRNDDTIRANQSLLDKALSGKKANLLDVFKENTDRVLEDIKKEIVNQVRQKIKVERPFTRGKEGEIYRIEIELYGEYVQVVIVKKLFSGNSENEFSNQEYFSDFFDDNFGDYDIDVPTPVCTFQDNGEEFIIMEEIKGKTLYTLIREAIINKIISEIYKRIDYDEQGYYKQLLSSFVENYSVKDEELSEDNFFYYLYKGFYVSFDNDTVSEDAANEFLELYNNLFSNNYNLEDIYKQYLAKISIFSNDQRDEISNLLSDVITSMNQNGYFHRDLGGNPRNLMVDSQTGKIYIIDFGKSLIDENISPTSAFFDQFEDRKYDPDINIVKAYIKQLGGFSENALNQQTECLFNDFSLESFKSCISEILPSGINLNLDTFFEKINKADISNKNIYFLLRNELIDQIEGRDKYIGDRKIRKKPTTNKTIEATKNGFSYIFYYMFLLDYQQLYQLKVELEQMEYSTKPKDNYRNFYIDIINKVLSYI